MDRVHMEAGLTPTRTQYVLRTVCLALVLVAAFRADATDHWLWAVVAVGASVGAVSVHLVRRRKRSTHAGDLVEADEPTESERQVVMVWASIAIKGAAASPVPELYGFGQARREFQPAVSRRALAGLFVETDEPADPFRQLWRPETTAAKKPEEEMLWDQLKEATAGTGQVEYPHQHRQAS